MNGTARFLKLCLVSIFVLVIFAAPRAYAQTLQEIQAQLEVLRAQLQILLDRASQQDIAVPDDEVLLKDGQVKAQFTHTLSRGATDATTDGEVSLLQIFLANDPDIYPEGLVTGYFGPLTERAVQRWQARMNIVSSGTPATTGYGVVGPRTRAVLNSYNAGGGFRPPILPPLSVGPFQVTVSGDISVVQPFSGLVTASNTVTVISTDGRERNVTFAQSGFPAGVSAASIGSCTTPCTKTNVVTVRSTAALSTSTITLTLRSGTSTASTTYTLRVLPPVPLRFAFTTSTDISVSQPAIGSISATSTIRIILKGGTPRPITVTQSGFPANVSAAPLGTCIPPCELDNVVTARVGAPVGTHQITVTAVSGAETVTSSYNLVITPPQPFIFTLSNSGNLVVSKPIVGEFSVSNDIGVSLIQGQTRPVLLTQSGLPSGVTARALGSCSPPCTRTNTLTIQSTASVGTSTVVVVGSAGDLLSSTVYTLTITESIPLEMELSASSDIIIKRPTSGGASGSNLITAKLVKGLAQSVSFSQRGFPAGAGATFFSSCIPTCSGTNIVTVNASTPIGTYPITVIAAGGGTTSTAIYNLVVTE